MTPNKLSTLPLRAYEEAHKKAGECARVDDVPWWAAFGYAASVAGTSDAVAVMVTAQAWLTGYMPEDERNTSKAPEAKLIRALIENPL